MKRILINLALIGLLIVVIVMGTLWYLDIYTHHNSELIEVADLENKPAKSALQDLESIGLEGVVTDTVYKDGAKKLAVINQNPAAGLMVKLGRKVYLVINTDKVPMVAVPDLADKTSLPQATNILLRKHLKVGRVIRQINSSVLTKTDEPVLAQYYPGTTTPIKSGDLIERNSAIDLVVGISADYYDSDSTTIDESNPIP